MNTIRKLPPNVVNQIAAGEVIERPASVVKELLENAVDAGARRIDVSIDEGGRDLVRVVDDGRGIPVDQLPLAVASHATSKLQTAADLFHVSTLGFRGEALASIASVSQLLIRSRPAAAEAAAQIEMGGGDVGPTGPCGGPAGTLVEVRNLFFNTPVRRKFLRTVQTETGHATEAFTRIALAQPEVHFTFTHNGRKLFDLAPTHDWRGRIASFFGPQLAAALIDVEANEDEIELAGYVANPSHSRANNRLQYLFLNGRAIRDRSLQHALMEAYRGLLLSGRFPICFLRLTLSPEMIDVNVHPTKSEVRFQDSNRLYSHLLGTLRTRFLQTDLTARFDPAAASGSAPEPARPFARPAGERTSPGPQTAGAWTGDGPGGRNRELSGGPAAAAPPPWPSAAAPAAADALLPRPPAARGPELGLDEPVRPRPEHGLQTLDQEPTRRAIQVHNRYLVVECDAGFVVFDQHALHERILYEQIRARALAGRLECQNLLVPEPVDLTATEAAAVLQHRELLAQMGVEVQPFGGDTVLVAGYPAVLAKARPADVLRGLVERLLVDDQVPDQGDLLEELLQMISCKAAVKAGDPLSAAEIDALLEQRDLAQNSHHCPHGRPSALVFSREDLDRQFKRT